MKKVRSVWKFSVWGFWFIFLTLALAPLVAAMFWALGFSPDSPYQDVLFASPLAVLVLARLPSLELSKWDLLAMLVGIILISLKIFWGVYDGTCPVGHVGLIAQIQAGIFPTRYTSFPEIITAYHPGFSWLAGHLGLLLGLDSTRSFEVGAHVFGSMSFLALVLGLKCHFDRFNTSLFLVLFFLSGSFPGWKLALDPLQPVTFHHYVLWWEHFPAAVSWSVALALLVVFFYLLGKQVFDHQQKSPLQLILDLAAMAVVFTALSVHNAFVFTVAKGVFLLLMGFLSLKQIFERKRVHWAPLALLLLFLSVARIPDYLPSAFLKSPLYEALPLTLAPLRESHLKTLSIHYDYVGGAIFVILYFLWLTLKSRGRELQNSGLIFLFMGIIGIFVPAVFWVDGLDHWDNLHRFSLLAQFSAGLLIVTSAIRRRQVFLCLLAIMLIPSFPVLVNHFALRISFNPYWNRPVPNSELHEWLNANKSKVFLRQYQAELACEGARNAVNQSANWMSGAYFKNFLLSKELEERYDRELQWWSDPKLRSQILSGVLDGREVLITRKSLKEVQDFFRDSGFDRSVGSSSEFLDIRWIRMDDYLLVGAGTHPAIPPGWSKFDL